MQFTELTNIHILNKLNIISDLHEDQLLNLSESENKEDYSKTQTSNDYLSIVKKDRKHIGFPLESNGVDAKDKETRQIINKLGKYISCRTIALAIVYPSNGYIGWHTNENATGHNLIFSYCQDEEGWFKYQDPKTKQIITLKNKLGWSAKFGYYGNTEDTILWHCAYNKKPKITLGFIIPNKHIRDDVVDQLKLDSHS